MRLSAQLTAAEEEEAAIQAYMGAGKARALALNNRGPIRFGADGNLAQEIIFFLFFHV